MFVKDDSKKPFNSKAEGGKLAAGTKVIIGQSIVQLDGSYVYPGTFSEKSYEMSL